MNVQVKVGLGFQFSQSRIAAADPDSDKKFLLKKPDEKDLTADL